ncbi:P-loop containing nucleoside triphosphate hydrolase protein [Mycena sp. CBHHK59/15]|nr:P-loop containing nucleoside triphosphate hydrolase protein [Mycena sp. CBHHK59/15]
MPEPNTEQTCSLFSSLTYSYLDPLYFAPTSRGNSHPMNFLFLRIMTVQNISFGKGSQHWIPIVAPPVGTYSPVFESLQQRVHDTGYSGDRQRCIPIRGPHRFEPAPRLSRNQGKWVGYSPMGLDLGVILDSIRPCGHTSTLYMDRDTEQDEFLRTTELLDTYSVDDHSTRVLGNTDTRIGFRDAEFSWSSQDDDSSFRLRINSGSEVIFQPGVVNLIVGPTGVGKTAVLLALLGEMHFTPAGPEPWLNLPREGGIAYASQQSFVQNESIKDNIIFGSRFDEGRYKKVLYACALYPDLKLLEAGDETEYYIKVGERGLTLSGGQKARVTLARAIYSDASILLLDDIFAALDVHTAKWIVQKCFSSDLIQGRTVLLVTHNIALVRPVSRWVVSLESGGSITQGPVKAIVGANEALTADVLEEQTSLEQDIDSPGSDLDDSKPKGKLIMTENSQEGVVKWPIYKLYLSNLSPRPVLYVGCILGLFILNEAATSFQFWFLGFWSSRYIDRPASEVSAPFYLAIYAASVFLSMALYIAAYTFYAFGTTRATKLIHQQLINSIIGATLRWLDTTPTSRVITRITQDINKVDNNFAFIGISFTELSIFVLAKFAAVMILSPAFILPGAAVTFVSVYLGRVYMTAQIPIQRRMSAARSPVLAHFAAAITVSIRAYGVEKSFLYESTARIDHFIRPAITFWNLNRWIAMRSDVLGGVFTSGLGWYLVYGGGAHYGAANVGFSITTAVSFTSMILIWVKIFNGLQLDGMDCFCRQRFRSDCEISPANNLERVLEFIEIEQEACSTNAGVPPAYWPASGEIRVENLSAKYSDDGPEVLHDITFNIKAGERISIVGRTGSGKSSLTLALLRCIPTQGKVYYDGIPIDSINLDALRSNITIIPQVPELLRGSLRKNLDPFGVHEDSVLNDALRAAGLFTLQTEAGEPRFTLDSAISSEGGNISIGQRQIVALARAIVRQSKLLILDEATSAIGHFISVLSLLQP